MRTILLILTALLFAACADKTATAPSKSKPNPRDALAAADSAFEELEAGKAPASAPSSSRGGKYNETLKAANEAQKELECSLSGTCPSPSPSPSPKAKVEEKPSPSALEEKARPGGGVAEGAAPKKGGKYPLAGGYPVWVSSPVYDGYIGGVGTAKPSAKGGYPVQRRTAITLAQADLARSVKISVGNELTLERTNVDTNTQKYYSEKFSTMSRQEAGDFMSNTTVMDEWTDPKTGELYIWVVLPR